MTNPTPLSPAAHTVLDAAEAGLDGYIELLPPTWKSSVAAAIRAIADHVVAEDALYARSCCEFVGNDHRSQLLAIADELEAQQ